VIQRSYVGRKTTNIVHIASVPLTELGVNSETPEDIIAEVLGIPNTKILDAERYRNIIGSLRGSDPEYPLRYYGIRGRAPRFRRQLLDIIFRDSSIQEVFSDFITAASAPALSSSIISPFNLNLSDEALEIVHTDPEAFACTNAT